MQRTEKGGSAKRSSLRDVAARMASAEVLTGAREEGEVRRMHQHDARASRTWPPRAFVVGAVAAVAPQCLDAPNCNSRTPVL